MEILYYVNQLRGYFWKSSNFLHQSIPKSFSFLETSFLLLIEHLTLTMLIVVSVTLFCQFPMLYYGLGKKNFK